jgi:hypothetical protein
VNVVQDPMEVYIDDEAKLTLHGLQQHYVKLKDSEKNRKLFELLDVLEFNQVRNALNRYETMFFRTIQCCGSGMISSRIRIRNTGTSCVKSSLSYKISILVLLNYLGSM